MSNQEKENTPPQYLYNPGTKVAYKCLELLKVGTFAKYYKIADKNIGGEYIAKVVSNKNLEISNIRRKIQRDIYIRQKIYQCHSNIVKFYGSFADDSNLYMVLEYCENGSMLQLLNQRKKITNYECRFFMYDLVNGVKFLHQNRITHGNLQLKNLLLDSQLHIKITDFESATNMSHQLTPQAQSTPEVVKTAAFDKYQLDIWTIGCIMYTLLVGQPPYEISNPNSSKFAAQVGVYNVPDDLHLTAVNMIVAILNASSESLPNADALLGFDFLNIAHRPTFLPYSCLTEAPHTVANEANFSGWFTPFVSTFLKKNLGDKIRSSAQIAKSNNFFRWDIDRLHEQLTSIIKASPKLLSENLHERYTDNTAQPKFWISQWALCEEGEKNNFGYTLCNDCVGVRFKDTTTIMLLPNQHEINYINKGGKTTRLSIVNCHSVIKRKMELLTYLKQLMCKKLVKTGAGQRNAEESDKLLSMPHLHTWLRTDCVMLMHLSNGTVQLNFTDHIKIILCPRERAVTYMNDEQVFLTYRFSSIIKHGCSKSLYEKLCYAHEKLGRMLEKKFF